MRMWSVVSERRLGWRRYGMLLMMLVGLLAVPDAKGQTAVQLIAGDSYSIGVRLDSAYNMARLTKMSVFVGNKEMCSTANGTLPLAEGQTRVYKCNLSSEATGKMRGDFQLTIGVTDTQMGVKNKVAGTLKAVTTMNATRANVVNGGFDAVVDVVMGNTQLTTTLSVLNLVRGYSAYEIAVQNGFVGNQAAWLATFTVPKDTAVLARNQALAYRNAAAASAASATLSQQAALVSQNAAATSSGTATTQAGIATTQATNAGNSATTATTQAGISTTQATAAGNSAAAALASQNAAATSAASATLSQQAASTQATAAGNSATTATTQAGIATTQATASSNSAAAALASQNAAATSASNAAGTLANAALKSNNLSDLTNATTARTNLGLGNVNNTTDANKPVSTATQTALDLKANLNSPNFTGTPNLPTGTTGVTQSAGNSTTALATTAFVTTANNLKLNITNPAVTGKLTTPDILVSNLTPNTIVATDASDNLVSLATATYPSLAELATVKGTTTGQSIQTQLNGKFATPSGLTTNTLPKWTGSAFGNSLISDNGTTVTIPTLGVTNDATINGLRIGVGNFYQVGNSAFGINSLLANVSGADNTSIGATALTNLTSGNNNTALGRSAGRFIVDGVTTLTNSVNSVFIGSYAYPLGNNQINQIVIGNGATGLGSNTSVLGSSSTTFGRWWGNLLIGSSTNSGELLQVNGTSKLAGNTAIIGNLSATGLHTITGTTASDTAPLGAELLDDTGWTSSGWTGSWSTGWTHTAGNTDVLSDVLPAVVGASYQIAYTITGRTTGSITITFGGEALAGINATGATGPRATTTGNLLITPTSDFNGTLVISIKAIGTSAVSILFNSSSAIATNGIRISNIATNTFIGSGVARSNTTGGANSFYGTNSGFSNTTGGNNVFIGLNSGRLNSIGGSNTFVGVNSGENTVNSGSNTYVGVNSGRTNTIGGGNTAIGANAGRFISGGTIDNTNANSSTFIGTDSRALADGQTNQIVISGSGSTGLGTHTSVMGNASTVQTHLYGSLTIGGTTTLDASAIADFRSTTRGFLAPRMTTTQRNAIATPAAGLQVYDTDLNRLMIHNGTVWGSVGAMGGSVSTTASATTSFVVTIGSTMPNTSYRVHVTPTSSVAAGNFFVTNKTTTAFTVTYTTALTGTVAFDWSVFR